MRLKVLKIPAIIMVIGLVLCLAAYFLTGILKEPTIKEQDFHYSVTYKLDGETKTIDGVYRVRFSFTGEGIDPLERYYDGYYLSESDASGEPLAHVLAKKDDLVLRVVFIFTSDYLMGDGDPGDEYWDVIPEPYLAVYDQEGYEYPDPDMVGKFNAELISWEMPQPIENTFVFSGFARLHDGSMVSMLLASVLTLVACLVFVKRDKLLPQKNMDNISVVFHYIIGFGAVPFMTLVCYLMGLYSSGEEIIYQIDRCVPAIAVFALAASLSLRRKGFTKSGFIVQFLGPALFLLLAILESVL